MNDGAVDERGRFWVGEVDLREINRGLEEGKGGVGERRGRGRLWRFQRVGGEWRCDRMDGDFVCGNGIGWSPDGKCSEWFPFLFEVESRKRHRV